MKNSNYYFLKYVFIFFFMVIIFILVDIGQGMSDGVVIAKATRIDANWITFGIFSILLLTVVGILLTLWSIKQDVSEPSIFIVINERNAEIVYIGTSIKECEVNTPKYGKYVIIPYERYESFKTCILSKKGGREPCCHH